MKCLITYLKIQRYLKKKEPSEYRKNKANVRFFFFWIIANILASIIFTLIYRCTDDAFIFVMGIFLGSCIGSFIKMYKNMKKIHEKWGYYLNLDK